MQESSMLFSHKSSELYVEDLACDLAILPTSTVVTPCPLKKTITHWKKGKNARCDTKVWTYFLKQRLCNFFSSLRSCVWRWCGRCGPYSSESQKGPPPISKKKACFVENPSSEWIDQFLTFQWASLIFIVIKKNGEIRLCIDYRKVNALTKLMLSSVPNIDELLLNFDIVMWYCSFDACSRF